MVCRFYAVGWEENKFFYHEKDWFEYDSPSFEDGSKEMNKFSQQMVLLMENENREKSS